MKNTQISSQLPHDCSSNGPAVSIFHHRATSMTKHLRIIHCLLLVSLFSPLAAYGQTVSAAIVGTVVAHSGPVLPNGVGGVISLGTNAKTVVNTGAHGSYAGHH